MHDESTSWLGYEAHIKPGDAVATPDERLWVVDRKRGGHFDLVSASRDEAGPVIEDDHLTATLTTVPKAMVTKVADATDVVRSRT